MKKAKKLILWAGSVLAGLIILLILAVGIFADFALKTAVETAGTKALNVGVTVDKTDLGITSGTLDIENLVIKNPPGYQHENLLILKNASTAVNIRTLLSDTVQIKELILDGVEVVIEQKGVSTNNLQELVGNIKKNRKQPSETDKPAEKKEGKKLKIDNLEIRNVTVKAKPLPTPGKLGAVTLKLAPIKMKNIGGENKITATELAQKIMLAITGGIAEQGSKLPGQMLDTITGGLKDFDKLPGAFLEGGGKILEGAGESLKGAGDEAGKVGESIKEGGEKLGEGIKNLFGGGKKEE
jgi:hypothetical protein